MFGRKTFLDPDVQDWHLSVWAWLLRNHGDLDRFARTPLVVPDGDFFPPTDARGHARAEYFFSKVRKLMGVDQRPVELVAAEERPTRVGPVTALRHTGSSQVVRYDNGRFQISYLPEDIKSPKILVAVLAHRLAAVATCGFSECPSPREMINAVDNIASTFFGFGVFGANAAFSFSQSTEFDSQGWRSRRVGELGEDEWAFDLALFCRLTGRSIDVLKQWTKSTTWSEIRAAAKIIERDNLAARVLSDAKAQKPKTQDKTSA